MVRDGVEALDFLFGTGAYEGRDTRVMPQVVLLDLKLPQIDGLEGLKQMREDPRTKRLPVVILTSWNEEQDLITDYSVGANIYIPKPVGFTQFAKAVRQLQLYRLMLNEELPGKGGFE